MVFMENLIHILYFVMAGLIGASFLKSFFKRKKNKGIVFDIMYHSFPLKNSLHQVRTG